MADPIPTTLQLDQGRDFYCSIVWKDKTTGNPYNLTGYTGAFNIAANYNRPVLISAVWGVGVTAPTPANGTFLVHLTAAQVETLGEGSFVAEFIAINGSVKTSLMKGLILSKGKVGS
jgi:hypothetical protein